MIQTGDASDAGFFRAAFMIVNHGGPARLIAAGPTLRDFDACTIGKCAWSGHMGEGFNDAVFSDHNVAVNDCKGSHDSIATDFCAEMDRCLCRVFDRHTGQH